MEKREKTNKIANRKEETNTSHQQYTDWSYRKNVGKRLKLCLRFAPLDTVPQEDCSRLIWMVQCNCLATLAYVIEPKSIQLHNFIDGLNRCWLSILYLNLEKTFDRRPWGHVCMMYDDDDDDDDDHELTIEFQTIVTWDQN